jgi:hypothetical protein
VKEPHPDPDESHLDLEPVVRTITAVVAAAVQAAGLVSCGGIERGAYVKANERLFEQLPRVAGARLYSERSMAYRASDSAPVIGYNTVFELRLPRGATATSVGSFFRRRLRTRWRLVETLHGPQQGLVLNFRRGRAGVSINLFNARIHMLEVAVDHAYYGKLGR